MYILKHDYLFNVSFEFKGKTNMCVYLVWPRTRMTCSGFEFTLSMHKGWFTRLQSPGAIVKPAIEITFVWERTQCECPTLSNYNWLNYENLYSCSLRCDGQGTIHMDRWTQSCGSDYVLVCMQVFIDLWMLDYRCFMTVRSFVMADAFGCNVVVLKITSLEMMQFWVNLHVRVLHYLSRLCLRHSCEFWW